MRILILRAAIRLCVVDTDVFICSHTKQSEKQALHIREAVQKVKRLMSHKSQWKTAVSLLFSCDYVANPYVHEIYIYIYKKKHFGVQTTRLTVVAEGFGGGV